MKENFKANEECLYGTCALCMENDANKKNTHYLTDGIIRSCINQEGVNEREAGYYFDIDDEFGYVEFNFQRATSIEKLEMALGRQATDDEIEKAKQIPLSVNHVFCSECEDRFSKIEDAFIKNVLPKFRNADLSGVERIEIADDRLARIFFALQIWRSAVCEPRYVLDEKVFNDFRLSILRFYNDPEISINQYSIAVTYLETLGEPIEYTRNEVKILKKVNPNTILFNDFIIQFSLGGASDFEANFCGLAAGFENSGKGPFIVPIVPDSDRRKFLKEYFGFLAKELKATIQEVLETEWLARFPKTPSEVKIQEHHSFIVNQESVLKYSRKEILSRTKEFVQMATR